MGGEGALVAKIMMQILLYIEAIFDSETVPKCAKRTNVNVSQKTCYFLSPKIGQSGKGGQGPN